MTYWGPIETDRLFDGRWIASSHLMRGNDWVPCRIGQRGAEVLLSAVHGNKDRAIDEVRNRLGGA